MDRSHHSESTGRNVAAIGTLHEQVLLRKVELEKDEGKGLHRNLKAVCRCCREFYCVALLSSGADDDGA